MLVWQLTLTSLGSFYLDRLDKCGVVYCCLLCPRCSSFSRNSSYVPSTFRSLRCCFSPWETCRGTHDLPGWGLGTKDCSQEAADFINEVFTVVLVAAIILGFPIAFGHRMVQLLREEASNDLDESCFQAPYFCVCSCSYSCCIYWQSFYNLSHFLEGYLNHFGWLS